MTLYHYTTYMDIHTFIYGYSSSLYTRIVATASMINTQFSCILCSLKMLLLELKQ